MHEHYLVRTPAGTWIDVRGALTTGTDYPPLATDPDAPLLRWTDPRDGTEGVAIRPNYVRHYPRYYSEPEKRSFGRARRRWGRVDERFVRRTSSVVRREVREEVGA